MHVPYSYPRPTAATNAILGPSADYNNNDYYDRYDEARLKADVIVGKPIPQSSGGNRNRGTNAHPITYDENTEDNGIRIIGDSCYYGTKYIAPANLCLKLSQAGQYNGPTSPTPGAFMFNIHHR